MTLRIAAYSISLNEEKHAARWAETTKGADIRIVCDTGSTDRTVEILREAGVTVYEISVKPWRFDVARNTALSLIPGDVDVCLSLDLDETVDDDFFDKVKEHYVQGANKIWCDFDTGHTWLTARMHSRHGVYWKYPIHEVFVPSLDTPLLSCTIPTKMYHKPDNTKPRNQYLPMLIAASKEMRNDHRIFTYLCREYYYYKMWDSVIDTATKLLEFSTDWHVERAAACRWASEASRNLGKMADAHTWADKAIEIDPCAESYFEKVRCYYADANWQGMWDTAKVTSRCARTNHYLSSESLWNWELDDMLALSAHYMGDQKNAIKHGKKSLEGNPTDERLKKNMEFYEQGSFIL